MPRKKMSEEEYAKAVSLGMNDLMEKKRKRNPHLYTKEFKAMAVAMVNENNKRRADLQNKKDVTKKKPVKARSSKK